MKIWRILATIIAVMALSVYVGLSRGASRIDGQIPVRVIELNKNAATEKIPVISGVAADVGGHLLATVGDDHVLRIWNLDDGAAVYRFAAHADWVKTVAFRPDGKTLATAGDDRCIRIWDITKEGHANELAEQPQAIHALVYSPDGQLLASAGFDDKVRLYAGEGRRPKELDGPGNDLNALAFSSDGSQLAAAGRAGTIRVWNVATGSKLLDIQASSRKICALAYSPNGRQLAAGGEDRSIRLFDAQTGKASAALPERPAKIRSLIFCGERLLAAGGTDNVIRLWNLADKSEANQLIGHTGTIGTLTYNPQTGTLISGSFDTTVRAWQITNQIEGISQR